MTNQPKENSLKEFFKFFPDGKVSPDLILKVIESEHRTGIIEGINRLAEKFNNPDEVWYHYDEIGEKISEVLTEAGFNGKR